jgi:hypothetical protein
MNLQPGELSYRGQRVKPKSFIIGGQDLRRLVGRCCTCGKVLRGKAAIPAADPYNSDINGDDTPVVRCSDCSAASSDSI